MASHGDASEEDSNYIQLLRLRGIDDPRKFKWVKKTNTYTSPYIQNEMLAIVFDHLKKNCCQYTKCFVLHNHSTVDETTDCSNKEQVVLVLRWFDCDFNVCEDFIGLYNVPSISTNVLTSVIKDALQRLDLCISKVYGQCYNGASNMSGGVAKQILDEEKHASFTHCYDHALTLACNDAVKGCKILRDALETT